MYTLSRCFETRVHNASFNVLECVFYVYNMYAFDYIYPQWRVCFECVCFECVCVCNRRVMQLIQPQGLQTDSHHTLEQIHAQKHPSNRMFVNYTYNIHVIYVWVVKRAEPEPCREFRSMTEYVVDVPMLPMMMCPHPGLCYYSLRIPLHIMGVTGFYSFGEVPL